MTVFGATPVILTTSLRTITVVTCGAPSGRRSVSSVGRPHAATAIELTASARTPCRRRNRINSLPSFDRRGPSAAIAGDPRCPSHRSLMYRTQDDRGHNVLGHLCRTDVQFSRCDVDRSAADQAFGRLPLAGWDTDGAAARTFVLLSSSPPTGVGAGAAAAGTSIPIRRTLWWARTLASIEL